jgi:hypothetical protein
MLVFVIRIIYLLLPRFGLGSHSVVSNCASSASIPSFSIVLQGLTLGHHGSTCCFLIHFLSPAYCDSPVPLTGTIPGPVIQWASLNWFGIPILTHHPILLYDCLLEAGSLCSSEISREIAIELSIEITSSVNYAQWKMYCCFQSNLSAVGPLFSKCRVLCLSSLLFFSSLFFGDSLLAW